MTMVDETTTAHTGPENPGGAPASTDEGTAPTGVTAAPRAALRDEDFWLFRDYPLSVVTPVVLVTAAATWVATVFALPLAAVAGIGAAVLLLGLAPMRRRAPRSLAGMCAGAVGFRWYRMRHNPSTRPPEPFDVPVPEGGSYGLRWDNDRLITMLRIEPPPDMVTWLRPGSLDAGQLLPLGEVANCLSQFDITLSSIDVISAGARTASNGPVAQIYDSILGPLPAIARRTVWLVLRLDPLANAEAVANRSGGGEGALRTAIIATRRVANRLAAHGITVSVLTAAEINTAVQQLTHGISVDQFTETTASLQYQGVHLTSYTIGNDLIGTRGFADLWSTPSLSTTIAVRLRPVPPRGDQRAVSGLVSLNALVRFDTMTAPEGAPVPGLRRLPGQQRRALLNTLPIGTPDRPADEQRGPLDALTDLTVPTAGCGQLIGADTTGQGIAVPLLGEGTRYLEVIGNLDLAQQVVLRALALGARAVVHTTRTEAWYTMVNHVGAPHALSLAPRSMGTREPTSAPVEPASAPYPTTTMVVFDGITPTALPGGATIVYVHADEQGHAPFDADVTLMQQPSTPNQITVRTAAGSSTVQMVTTPDEMQYIGESLVTREAQ